MDRGLIRLERQILNKNVGVADSEIVVCAFNSLEDPGYSIDQLVVCDNFAASQKAEEKLRADYPSDTTRILMTKTRRIK